MSIQLTLDLPEEVFPMLRTHPDNFIKEMRLAAAIKWFEIGHLSQANAAELAELSRQQFIEALSRYHVSPIQMTPEDNPPIQLKSVPSIVKARGFLKGIDTRVEREPDRL